MKPQVTPNKFEERMEKESILEFISLGRGNVIKKEKLAKELGISLSTLKYRVDKFKNGQGVGRKKRNDAGIPKKDIEAKTKLEFFAELALGASVDEATNKLGISEHQGNQLAKEYKNVDKFKAIRNAPQLDQLKDLIKDIFKLDIAIVDAEMHGAFNVQVESAKGEKIIIPIPVRQINDIQVILSYCLQISEMAKIDPDFKAISDEQLMLVRLNYLKHDLCEKRNITELTRLMRATKINNPERQLDLKLVYAIIERYAPELDETSKIKVIREEYSKIAGSKQ
jgi:transposase